MATLEELKAERERRQHRASPLDRLRAEKQRRSELQRFSGRPNTSFVEQGMSGVNEGLAGVLGFPVDAATMAINAGLSGVNKVAGTSLPKIENPVGGSGTFSGLMEKAGSISDVQPQNVTQRYARRIGREVGFGAPIAVATGGGAAASGLAKLMAANATADTAAGVAGQTAREIAPDSTVADIVASILAGGGAAAGLARTQMGRAPAPYQTTDEMFDAAGRGYERAYEGNPQLTRSAQEGLFSRLEGRLKEERATPRRHPRAYDAVQEAKNWPNAQLRDIEETRSIFGRDVAGNADEAPIGMALKSEIDDYLNGLKPSDVTGNDPAESVAELLAARKLSHQAHKARAVEGAAYRASSRAATSGTGGNEVNTMRQNVRSILDSEVAPRRAGKRSGYSRDEIAQMEKIVFGTRGGNSLRLAGRLAPSSGGLAATLMTAGTGGATLVGGGPGMALSAGLVGGAELAKMAAERMTKKEIDELLEIIRRGGVAQKRQLSPVGRAILKAATLSSMDGAP